MTKTRKDNDVIDHISAVYVKNDIELSWLIIFGVNGYKNKIGELRVQKWSMMKMKLSCHDWSD